MVESKGNEKKKKSLCEFWWKYDVNNKMHDGKEIMVSGGKYRKRKVDIFNKRRKKHRENRRNEILKTKPKMSNIPKQKALNMHTT